MNAIVKELRAKGSRPPCLIDRDDARQVPPRSLTAGTQAESPRPPPTVVQTDRDTPPIEPHKAPEVAAGQRAPSSLDIKPDFAQQTVAGSGDLIEYKNRLVAAGANAQGVDKALAFFQQNRSRFENQDVITFIDFTKPQTQKRLFVLDTRTGEVSRYHVAHGAGNGRDKSRNPFGGVPTRFSNEHGSNLSSVGAYKIGQNFNRSEWDPRKNNGKGYPFKHRHVLLIDGLESTNNEARDRGVYMHDVWDYSVRAGGRTQGCPGMDPKDFKEVRYKIDGGSFMYIYSDRA